MLPLKKRSTALIVLCIIALMLSTTVSYGKVSKTPYVKGFRHPIFAKSSQVITVTNSTLPSRYATVNAYEKTNGVWKLVFSNMGSLIGKNGMQWGSIRKQSTYTTPTGIYNILFAFGWAANPGTKLRYRMPGNRSYWNLNSGSQTYNRWVEGDPGGDREALKTQPLYKYAMALDYNVNQVRNKGGAIFIHINPRYYTAGCVGLSETNLVKIMRWLDPAKNPKVLIAPSSSLRYYYY